MTSVAIVDDERSILISLRMHLQAEGYDVRTFSDPRTALPKLICEPPSLLILNGRMPGMHGIEFFQKYREFSRGKVIFLSASATEIAEQLEVIGLPADDYVQKPFDPRHVSDLVRRLTQKRPDAVAPGRSRF
jgi:two-component system response regulator ChvI